LTFTKRFVITLVTLLVVMAIYYYYFVSKGITCIRLAEKNNSTRRRRIWVRLQGASAGAYLLYVPVDATP
jgi:hypothetical protein